MAVNEKIGTHFTRAILTGPTFGIISDELTRYFDRYQPAGYMTKIELGPMVDKNGDWRYEIKRYSSCD